EISRRRKPPAHAAVVLAATGPPRRAPGNPARHLQWRRAGPALLPGVGLRAVGRCAAARLCRMAHPPHDPLAAERRRKLLRIGRAARGPPPPARGAGTLSLRRLSRADAGRLRAGILPGLAVSDADRRGAAVPERPLPSLRASVQFAG